MRTRNALLVCLLAPLLLAALFGCNDSAAPGAPAQQHWYEGGTLHNARVREWWRVSHANKLATCADFVANVWNKGHLNAATSAKLHTVDDLRPLAEELVTFVDTATKEEALSEEAKKSIENSEISQLAAAGIVTMGWSK